MKGRTILAFAAQLAAAVCALTIATYYSITLKAAVLDPDIWWHIRIGDWIVAHRGVPHVGVLSQHIERPFLAYSWLFELLLSGVHRVYGLPGLQGFLIVLQVLIAFVLLVAIRRLAKGAWRSWLIAALSVYAFYIYQIRSYQFSMLFFTVELAILFEVEQRKDDRVLFWTAPLFLVWANVHIQFVYGLFVLGVYVAARLVTEGPRAAPAGALASAFVCSCIGPNFVRPHLLALNFASHPTTFQLIDEGKALTFRRPENYVELLLLMGACFAAGRLRRPGTLLFRASLLLVTAMVSFRAMRDSWFVCIAAAFVIAEAAGERYGDAGDDDVARAIRPVLQYSLAAVLALVVAFGVAIREGMSQQDLVAVVDGAYPVRASAFVQDAKLAGPMYNDFNWGGFLIFNLPGYPVSIDPRGDLYGDDLIVRAVNTINAGPGWQDDPDLQRARFVLIERIYPLAAMLERDPRFRRVYEDPIAVVFVRR